MVSKQLLNFLKGLKENNNKEWFDANRKSYEDSKKEFEQLTASLISELGKFDKDILELRPKDCVFRIFRDVRFSADKTPYKSNFGAHIVKNGRKSNYSGYYLHLEDGGSFLGGGLYMPQPDVLKAVREKIYDNINDFLKITENKKFVSYFGSVEGSSTKLAPKGFPKDFEHIDLLKLKDYTMIHNLKNSEITDKNFIKNAKDIFREMKPFNNFMNEEILNLNNL